MEEIKKLKVNLTDPYEWEGKITDPEEAEKLAEGMYLTLQTAAICHNLFPNN